MPAQIARRKCRQCAKTSVVAFNIDICPKCSAPYGRFEIGFDQEVLTEQGKKPNKEVRE